MKTQKTLSIGILVMFVLPLMAEVQTGYVRTIGRNGKPGQPISGVMVRAEGPANMVMSDAQGQFTLTLHEATRDDAYRLASVKKNNYELLDKDVIGREYGFTTVPMEIVLVNLTEMQAEKAAMAERFERQYAETYQKKMAELQAQYEAKQITGEEYATREEELTKALETMLAQIETLVDRYVRTDYDRLDSLDQVINAHIELGEFDEAERLIRSKGSIQERLADLQEGKEAQRQIEEAERKLAETKQQVIAANDKKRENLKCDLNLLIDIAEAHLRPDSAYYYRKQLAEIAPEDVENIQNLMWAAYEFEDNEQMFTYFDIAETGFLSQSRIDTFALAELYDNMGEIITFKLKCGQRRKNDTIIFGTDYYKKKLNLLCSYYGSNSFLCAQMLQKIALIKTLDRSSTPEKMMGERNFYYEQARDIYQNILERDSDNLEALAGMCEVQKWLTGNKEEYRQCVLSLLEKTQIQNKENNLVIKQIIDNQAQVLWAFSQEEVLEMIYYIYSKHISTYEDSLHVAEMLLDMTEQVTISLADSCRRYAINLMTKQSQRQYEYKRLSILGSLYCSIDEYAKALMCYDLLHQHDILVYGNCSRNTRNIKSKLAKIYAKLKDYDKSQFLREEIMQCIREKKNKSLEELNHQQTSY